MGKRKRKAWPCRLLVLTILINIFLVFSALAAGPYYFSISEEAYWGGNHDGVAHWKKVEKAKEYEVLLYRGDTRIKRVCVKAAKVDLSEYMENNQVYTFAVRAIPTDSQRNYRAGEWLFSEELYVDWLGTTSGRWRVYSTGKKYQKEDRTYCANGWEMIQGDWYYFNAEGYVQTGWIQVGDKQYYLDGDGKMKTGWLQSGENWYYLGVSGDMKIGWVETAPGEWYYMDADGKMLANTIVEGYQLNEKGLMVK